MKMVTKIAAGLGLIVLAVLGAVAAFPSCGWSDCYQSMKFSRPDLERRNALWSFAASEKAVAFSVLVATDTPETVGLLYFDRSTKRRSLIQESQAIMVSPRFSEDGTQMLFVRSGAKKCAN